MIFPWLDGLTRWRQSPITWLILTLNLFCFAWSSPLTQIAQKQLEEILGRPSFLLIQGQEFANFITRDPDHYAGTYRRLARQALLSSDPEQLRHLGELATRDLMFLKFAPHLKLISDPIAENYWRTYASSFRVILESDPLTHFGLSHRQESAGVISAASFTSSLPSITWITYQFFHGGWGHLFGNMALFLIFGCWLEKQFGSTGFLFFYVTAGIIAGACFQAFTEVSSLPLVGASGSISGMMGAVMALHFMRKQPDVTSLEGANANQRLQRSKIKFVYFLLPLPQYMGVLYLPAWVALLFWLIPDISGWLATPVEVGGVAHLAHIGGLLFGAAIGIFMARAQGDAEPAVRGAATERSLDSPSAQIPA